LAEVGPPLKENVFGGLAWIRRGAVFQERQYVNQIGRRAEYRAAVFASA
jgi:hypothetical protein